MAVNKSGVYLLDQWTKVRVCLSPSHAFTLTHPLTYSLMHLLTHSLTHPHSPTHPLTHSPTHSLIHTLNAALSLLQKEVLKLTYDMIVSTRFIHSRSQAGLVYLDIRHGTLISHTLLRCHTLHVSKIP